MVLIVVFEKVGIKLIPFLHKIKVRSAVISIKGSVMLDKVGYSLEIYMF